MRERTAVLMLVAIGAMIVMLGILAIPAHAGEWGDEFAGFVSGLNLTTEACIVKPIAPDTTLAMGCSGSLKLWTLPDTWPVLGGRELFADLLIISDNGKSNPFLGCSVTLFERSRIGGAVWADPGTRWTIYLVQPLLTF